MSVTKAIQVRTVLVQDPDSRDGVELAVYKDPRSGSLFAVDVSFVEQVSTFLPGIYNSGTLQLGNERESESGDLPQSLPQSVWPSGPNECFAPDDYAVTITVDVKSGSFAEAKEAFIRELALGITDAAVFHIEHLRSGGVCELE